MSKNNIIRLNKNHIKSAGILLGRALFDDPVSIHVIPDSNERKEKLNHVFQMTACLGVFYGEAYATSENLEGIAVWIPFTNFKEKKLRMLRCATKAKLNKLGREAGKRFKPIEVINKNTHIKFALYEHWYLQSLGVDPEFQGRGYGSSLLISQLQKIDEQGLPVYLETSTEKNVRFYQKFGFEVVEEIIIPGTQVPEWFMLRK